MAKAITMSGAFVWFKGDWWKVKAEEPRDMYLLTLNGKESRVSLTRLMDEIAKDSAAFKQSTKGSK